MKNNLKLTYTGNVYISRFGTNLGDSNLEELLSGAMLTNDIDSKDFAARVTLTIEDISDPLRIEHGGRGKDQQRQHRDEGRGLL